MRNYFYKAISHPLFAGSAMMIIGSNAINLVNYIFHFIMGKMLGPSNYGELVALISVVGLIGVIPSSLSLVIIKYISIAKNNDEAGALTNWLKDRSFKVALLLCVMIIVISPFVASFLHINQLWYIILIAATFFFSIPTLVNRSVLQGLLRFKGMIISILSENIIKLILAVILVYIGFAVSGVMVSLAIASVAGWYFSKIYLLDFQKKKNIQLPDRHSMFAFAFPVIVQSFAITSLYSSDVILVKHFFSSSEAGIYSAISTLGKIIFFGVGPIGAVMFPIIAGKQARGENYKKIFFYSSFVTLVFSLSILFVYLLFPSFVISMLYSSSFLASKNLLFWFGLFMSLFTFSSLLINYSLSVGRTKVVILPLLASLTQIVAIYFYHGTLFNVIESSLIVITLLVISLLIYLSFGKGSLWK